jgi:hypothetical protein
VRAHSSTALPRISLPFHHQRIHTTINAGHYHQHASGDKCTNYFLTPLGDGHATRSVRERFASEPPRASGSPTYSADARPFKVHDTDTVRSEPAHGYVAESDDAEHLLLRRRPRSEGAAQLRVNVRVRRFRLLRRGPRALSSPVRQQAQSQSVPRLRAARADRSPFRTSIWEAQGSTASLHVDAGCVAYGGGGWNASRGTYHLSARPCAT